MEDRKEKRFVIQRHEREGEPAHWDLMLETGDSLATYRVNRPPDEWGDELIEAFKIFNHPMKFLKYEGIVNKGKGRVSIADSGTYQTLKHSKSQLNLKLRGAVLKGEFTFSVEECPARRE